MLLDLFIVCHWVCGSLGTNEVHYVFPWSESKHWLVISISYRASSTNGFMWNSSRNSSMPYVFWGMHLQGKLFEVLWLSKEGRHPSSPSFHWISILDSDMTLSLLVASQWEQCRTHLFSSEKSNFRFLRNLAIASKFSTFV